MSEHAISNEHISFLRQDSDAPLLTIHDDQHRPIVQIMRDATVRYADDVDLDEASRIFWEALARKYPQVIGGSA